MPTFQRIALANGQATPVVHDFDPANNDTEGSRRILSYEDRAAGSPVAYNRLVVNVNSGTPVRTVRITVRIPTLETVSGAAPSGYQPAPREAFYESVVLEFKTHQRGTIDGRKDLVAFAKNILENADIVSVLVDNATITG